MDSPEKNKILENIYYDKSNPASFSSVEKLYKEASNFVQLSRNYVRNWLKSQNTYTLHKQRRKRFVRNKIIVQKPNEQFQADLVDLQMFSPLNKGYKYILTVVDVFSKYAFAIALKTKESNEVKHAFQKIFELRKPEKLQTDKGKEFVNANLRNFLKQNEVHFFTSRNNEIKCSIVERFNRTLKEKMFKYFTAKGTRRWIDAIDDIVDAYNRTIHSSTKMSPISITEENAASVFQKLYGFESLRELLKSKPKKINYELNETVRIPHKTSLMDKGYYPIWTDKIYKIKSIKDGNNKKTIKVVDQHQNEVEKSFYPEEVQVINENLYRIEKILKKRKRKGKLEYLIKWIGYSDDFNSWEPANSVLKLNG